MDKYEGHDWGMTCPCVSEHRPPVLELELHHVWPVYLGGPKDGELVGICPTTHTNTHELIRAMMKARQMLSYRQCQEISEPRVVSRYAYTLATRAYQMWAASQSSNLSP